MSGKGIGAYAVEPIARAAGWKAVYVVVPTRDSMEYLVGPEQRLSASQARRRAVKLKGAHPDAEIRRVLVLEGA